MNVILSQDVPGVGKKWDTKEVKGGYGRNYLLPANLAVLATKGALENIKLKQKQEEQKRAVYDELLHKSLEDLKGSALVIRRKTNKKGHLFDGVDVKEISAILREKTRMEIPSEWIRLEKPIKESGKHKITLRRSGLESSFEIEIVSAD